MSSHTGFNAISSPLPLRSLQRLLMLFLLPLFMSCSLFKSKDSTLATRQTVLGVAANYLQYIVQGSEKRLNDIVLWDEYLKRNKEGMTREQFRNQLALGQGRWTVEQHPLVNLDVQKLDVDGDEAEVILQKVGRKDMPEIRIDLFWTGSGWLVVNDSLFGPSEETLFGKLATERKDKTSS